MSFRRLTVAGLLFVTAISAFASTLPVLPPMPEIPKLLPEDSVPMGAAPCVTTRPAPFSGKEGLRVGCEVNFLIDNPITVSATYEVHDGTPDAKGPQLVLRQIPWNGIVEARGIVFRAKAKPPAKK